MKRNTPLIFLVLCSFALIAQKAPLKFGDVSVEELKMTKYEKDSSASAVILGDFGQSSLDYGPEGFMLNYERTRRVKILTKDGLEWADFVIELYHNGSGDDEKLSSLKAVTYNLENGKIIESKAKGESIFKEKYDANRDRMKITFPNVKEGSVIEVTYKIASDFLFNFQDWQFQETIPVVWSEYRARIPEYFDYNKYMQGYVTLHVNEETQSSQTLTSENQSEHYQENRFRWATKDVPAFKAEPFMTTAKDYISKINFELSTISYPGQGVKSYRGSWADVNKEFSEDDDFGGKITGNGFLKKTVDEIITGQNTAEEKIAAIVNYVKDKVTWNEVSTKYTNATFKKVLEEKKGSCVEINLLLASMLEKAGINVLPVLVSTRDHGFVHEDIPASSQFNYVICVAYVGEKPILLDATEKFLPIGAIPERCINGKGFVIAKTGHKWLELQSGAKSRTIVNADFLLTDAGELKGKLRIEKSGYFAQSSRKKYFLKGEKDYLKDLIGNHAWEITASEFENSKDPQKNFVEKHDILVNEHATLAGDIIYINPFILYREEENPFKSEKREYPVNFGSPLDKMYMIKLTLPDGYVTEELPQSKVFVLPGNAAKYSYNVIQSGNAINITSSMAINHSLYSQMEYPNLREFYSHVVAKQAEQIVLKKK